MANASGHMSHHGAQGTVWTLVAPDELARLASLHPVATRRLPRVQGGCRPATASGARGRLLPRREIGLVRNHPRKAGVPEVARQSERADEETLRVVKTFTNLFRD